MHQPMIYPYARVSTLNQLDGKGLDMQLNQHTLDTLSKQYNLPIAETFTDEGKSAFHGTHLNHELGAFLNAIKAGDIATGSILVVYSLDRLSRLKLGYAKQIYLDLTNSGINIYSELDNHLYRAHNVADEIVSSITFERAFNESHTKQKRTIGAALARIQDHQKGIRASNGNANFIPMGRVGWWIDVKDGSVKLSDYYAPICREVITRSINGEGIIKILDWLNDTYEPPRTNKNNTSGMWNNNSISQLHKQKSLIGQYSLTINDIEHKLVDYIPPLISEEMFWQFAATKKRRTHTRSGLGNQYLLTGMGITKCGFCGGAVTSCQDGNRIRLRCINGSQRKGKCSGFSATGSHIEEAILESIGSIQWQPSTDNSGDVIDGLKTNIEHLKEQLNQVEQDYIANPSGILAKVLASKEIEITSKTAELEEALLKRGNDDWVMTELPTDTTGMRELIRRSFEKIVLLKTAGRSNYMVGMKGIRGFNTFIYISNGEVVKSGSIFHAPDDQLSLFEPSALALMVKTDVFSQWLASKWDCVDMCADEID